MLAHPFVQGFAVAILAGMVWRYIHGRIEKHRFEKALASLQVGERHYPTISSCIACHSTLLDEKPYLEDVEAHTREYDA